MNFQLQIAWTKRKPFKSALLTLCAWEGEELVVERPVECERKPFLNLQAFWVEEEKAERLRHSQQRKCLGWQPNVSQVLDDFFLCLATIQQQSFAKNLILNKNWPSILDKSKTHMFWQKQSNLYLLSGIPFKHSFCLFPKTSWSSTGGTVLIRFRSFVWKR